MIDVFVYKTGGNSGDSADTVHHTIEHILVDPVRCTSQRSLRRPRDAIGVDGVEVVLVLEEPVAGAGESAPAGEAVRPAVLRVVLVDEEEAGGGEHRRGDCEPRREFGVLQRREGERRFDIVLETGGESTREFQTEEIGREVRESEEHGASGEDDERDRDHLGRFMRLGVAPVVAPEGHPVGAAHVGGGHERGDQAEHEHQRVRAFLPAGRTGQDLVLRPETCEREDAGQRECGGKEGCVRDRHLLAKATHLAHVEGVMAGVAHRTGTEEQAGLEERVCEEMEDTGSPGADTEGHDHVTELGDRRIGEHLLQVGLHEGKETADDGCEATDERHVMQRARTDTQTGEEDAVETGDEVHAGDNHRRRMDQRRDGRRTGHRIGQPGVQRELARFRGDTTEETQTTHKEQRRVGRTRERVFVDVEHVEAVCTGSEERDRHADDQAHVTDTVREERLEGGVGVLLLFPPVPDETERTDADQLPAHQHLQGV